MDFALQDRKDSVLLFKNSVDIFFSVDDIYNIYANYYNNSSGLTCRTLSEFGASGLHHPAEAVRKVSERILVLVYKVNPRMVRKQLPPDDGITRRNLLYRQLFHEFDCIDMQVIFDIPASFNYYKLKKFRENANCSNATG